MEIPKVFHPSKSKYLVFTADYLLPTFICIGVLAMGYLLLYSSVFKIAEVKCSADYGECNNPSLIAELDKLKGQNIFTFSEKSITTRLTSGDFTIREVSVIKELPSSIKFELKSVYPVVAIQVLGDSTWVVLDEHLRVIGTMTSDPNVPTLIVPGPLTLTLGKVIGDSYIVGGLEIATTLAHELFTVKTITLLDMDTIELSLSDGRKALFTPKKDTLQQIRSLQAVLANATITTGAKTIDVRFARPVLR